MSFTFVKIQICHNMSQVLSTSVVVFVTMRIKKSVGIQSVAILIGF